MEGGVGWWGGGNYTYTQTHAYNDLRMVVRIMKSLYATPMRIIKIIRKVLRIIITSSKRVAYNVVGEWKAYYTQTHA